MASRHVRSALLIAGLAVVAAPRAAAQAMPPVNGRFSLFANWSERAPEVGETYTFSEVIAKLSLYPARGSRSSFEYGIDARVATYPSSDARDERVSIYEAWIGTNLGDGSFRLRLGQMWLHELGGLGALGGLLGEYRGRGQSSFGQFRFGLFAGFEPKIREAGYLENVEKGGIYVAVDGDHGRRHVLGWIVVRDQSLTERSVVVFSNFIPVGRTLFLYQALEYDLEGPAGLGSSELTYFFTNLRYAPARFLELQGTYHRGRSIDTRSITEDVLDGRAVDPARLDGLLFESNRIRVTAKPWRSLRIWVGYGRDRNDRSDQWNDRTEAGVSLNDVFGVGLDFTASNARTDRINSSYDSTYVSLGKALGRSVYMSLDYITSLSVFHYADGGDGFIEVRPESSRYGLSVNATLSRTFSLLVTGEWMNHDDFDELRILTGLTVRF